jgi:DnaK suppressor protein
MKDTSTRNAELRQMLSDRRQEIERAVQSSIRDERTDRTGDVRDDVELSDAGTQRDITFALIQLRAETLASIDAAVVRLEAGEYGSCATCSGEISARRLRAMPFAVRCQLCAERSEREGGQMRQLARHRGTFSLYPEAVGS